MLVPETAIIVTKDGVEVLRKIVTPGDYVIGREQACDVPVDADLVSRRHAQLTVNFDHVLIEDLGSSNGTFVNGEQISQSTRLWPNQKIQIGAATVELRRVKAVPQPDVTLAPSTEAVQRLLPEEFLRDRKYDIGKVVAQGGMGAILDAKEATIERQVAMKVMLDTSNPDDLSRFIKEAKITGQLEHPSVVPVHDLGVDENGQPFYTMKMVRGITLRRVLELLAEGIPETKEKYPLPVLLTIFQKVCDAIAFAHSKGVIHRDLKPENIMLDDFGVVLVMDWGLAKVIGQTGGSMPGDSENRVQTRPSETIGTTMAGTVMGTPQYMSPEQARGEVETLNPRSDIYALGAILYQILVFRPSVTGDDAWAIVEKVAKGEIEPLTGSNVPDSLVAVVRKAMAFDRVQRYESVEALQRDLAAYQTGFATSAENAGTWKQFTLLIRRNRVLSSSVLVVCLLMIGFTIRVLHENGVITGERNRANATLDELRGTAPTFEAQSRALLSEGRLDDALIKIGYAVRLNADSADYRVLRANLCQSTQRLNEATDEYRHALALRPGDPTIKDNLALTEKLLAEKGGMTELPVNLQGKLLDALVGQHRDLEAAPLSKLLKRDEKTAEATIRARLASYTTQKEWKDNRISHLGNGFLVNLGDLRVGDLNALRGLPIVELNLNLTTVSDLRPLAGLPLVRLNINSTRVSDLSPLRGMQLQKLEAYNTAVSDLSPLSGMPMKDLNIAANKGKLHDLKPLLGCPLERLNADSTVIVDLEPLRGMPLKEVNFHSQDSEAPPDFSPIAGSPTLEKIYLPWEFRDIEFLRTLQNLQKVDLHHGTERVVWMPVRDFFAMYGPDEPETKATRAVLAAAGFKDLPLWRVAMDPDRLFRINLRQCSVVDLSALRGLPIKELNLEQNGGVKDLEPLRGMPLVRLDLRRTSVRDVSVLASLHGIEEIILPSKVKNVEQLRSLPKLRYLATEWDNTANRPAQTAEEFWKEYDAKQKDAAPK